MERDPRPTDTPPAASGTGPEAASPWPSRREWLILALLMAFYLATRLWRIEHFPPEFLCDEAIQPVLGRDLVANHFRDAEGTLLPGVFRNYYKWSLGLSVYIHALTASLFGTSVLVTRATSVAVGALAPLAAALSLRTVFRTGLWWTAPLVMGLLPAWFLHSRTALEPAMCTGFWAVLVLAYLLYRTRSPRWLPLVVLAGAATFATYTNGRGLVAFFGGALLLVDWRYHLRAVREHRRTVVVAVVLALLLAVPWVRFRLRHPEAFEGILRDVQSYWIEDIPVGSKLLRYGRLYLEGLDPRYWFLDDPDRIPRHRIPGSGHLPLAVAPFLAAGVVLCLRRPGSPPHRTVLVAALAVPFAPAVAGIMVTRVLGMVVPATLFTVLGADLAWRWVRPRLPGRLPRRALAAATAALLVGANLVLARTCVEEGPRWYDDYGLYGLQWGAPEVFGAIREELRARPGDRILLSHGWTNNPDAFLRFFLTPGERRRVGLFGPGDHQRRFVPFATHTVFVITREELDALRKDPKIFCGAPLRLVPRPDGTPGFVFLRLDYTPEAPGLFAAEEADRQRPRRSTIRVDGERWVVIHPKLDMGNVMDPFDGNPGTVARSDRVDPAVWTVELPRPRPVAGVRLGLFARDYRITLEVVGKGGARAETVATFHDLPETPEVTVRLPDPVPDAVRVRLSLDRLDWDHHVHLRELRLLGGGAGADP